MRRFSPKLVAFVLVLAVASVFGAVLAAGAACNFSADATPNPAVAGSTVNLNSRCLHDVGGTPIEGGTINFSLQRPSDASAQPVGSATTNASGDATFPTTDTAEYGTYTMTATSADNAAVNASATFSVGGGAPAGTFTLAATNNGVSSDVIFTASQLKDSSGNATANGTVVTVSVTRPDSSVKTYTGTVSGVTGAADNASATITMPAADTAAAGDYSATATSGTATSGSALIVALTAGCAKTLAAVVPATNTVGSGSAVQFGANNVKDANGNLASGRNIDLHVVYPDSTSGDTTDTTDVNGAALTPTYFEGTDELYGDRTLTATANPGCGATDGPKTFAVQPANPDTIVNATGPATAIPAGTSAVISVNGIVDAYLTADPSGSDPVGTARTAAAKNGTVVTLSVVGPSGTRTYTATISGVDSAADATSVSFDIPDSHNLSAGTYNGTVTAGSATKTVSYIVSVGPPVPDMTIAAPDVKLGKAGTVTVSNIPSGTTKIELNITRPDATTDKVTKNAPCDPPLNDPCAFANNTTSISVTADKLNQIGDYSLSALGRNGSGTIVAGGSGVLKVTASALVVTASQVVKGSGGTVNVGLVPVGATTVELVLTKPDATPPYTASAAPVSRAASIAVPAAEIPDLGTYSLAVTAKNASNVVIGTGTGVLQVIVGLPDRIDVTISPSQPILPTNEVSITASAVISGPDPLVTTDDVKLVGRRLLVIVTNALGTVFTTQSYTGANGEVTWKLRGNQTLAPGTYKVSVRDHLGTGVRNDSATFSVLI